MILQSTTLINKSIYFIEAMPIQSRVAKRKSEANTSMFKARYNHMIIPLRDSFVCD